MNVVTRMSDWREAMGLGLLAMAIAALLVTSPVSAAKPDSPGKGNEKAASHGKSHGDHGKDDDKVKFHFDDRQSRTIRDYFGKEFSRGNCPPGLAKKRNGCLPPGQAKKWRIGHPLPHDVVYYDLPGALLRELGRTEEGYKLVRVGVDVLKIAVGTSMVVDAVENLSSL